MSIEVDIELPTLKELKVAFRMLPNNIAAKHMTAALGRAINPAWKRLKKNTPKGPSGNLKRAVAKKTKKYTKSGAGVALIGFRKPPRGTEVKDRKDNQLGYHAHFLEKGTRERSTKGRLASSWNTRWPFEVVRYRSKKKANAIRTAPRPPRAFMKGAFAGSGVDLGKMPVGGRRGRPPLQTTYTETKSELEREIKLQMSASVEKAIMEMAGKFRTTGKR